MPHDDHAEFPLGEATVRVAPAPVGEPAGGAGGADLPGGIGGGTPVGSGDRVTVPASDALRAVLHGARLSASAVPAVLKALETWTGDCSSVPHETPRLPALLRVVEYVAAEVGGLAGEALREWSARVAQRLGDHPSALDERRADAARWAARTASAGACVPETYRAYLRLAALLLGGR
ncbi:hypothetical protein [Streptomyces sp. NRRL F-5755]|uniref:hypothetical protein n=1 Tax=Streptomyces sp. NRRL F-5755 TaxID=1519475 RepID=UPI0018FE2546|nr:hypothetical protein [Streptomyces sp. NRRL F-5755]